MGLLLSAQHFERGFQPIPDLAQALESLESCAPSVFHRLKLPNDKSRWASVNALQKILELGTSTTSVPTEPRFKDGEIRRCLDDIFVVGSIGCRGVPNWLVKNSDIFPIIFFWRLFWGGKTFLVLLVRFFLVIRHEARFTIYHAHNI